MAQNSNAASALLDALPARRGFGDATLIRHTPGAIDLGGGNPATDLLPVDLYRDAFHAVTADESFARLLRYSPAPGLPSLRAAIAAREGVDPDRVIITNGGAHGLALAVLGILDHGDVIVVDDPVYPLFLRVLDLVGVDVEPIRVADDGVDIDRLEERLRAGLRPKAMFTVPTFQNPSGVTLSTEKERALVALAERYGFFIIADDPYREIVFPGVEVPQRHAFRDCGRVVSVNTFSKTLGPGLRLGWLVLPDGLTEQFTRLRNRLDGQSSGVLQAVVERMLTDERLEWSLAAAGTGYAQRAEALVDALMLRLGDAVTVRKPDGGFFAWARFHDRRERRGGGGVDFAELFEAAQDAGVTYQRGEWFAASGRGHDGFLRLSFSENDDESLREGVARLADAWQRLSARR